MNCLVNFMSGVSTSIMGRLTMPSEVVSWPEVINHNIVGLETLNNAALASYWSSLGGALQPRRPLALQIHTAPISQQPLALKMTDAGFNADSPVLSSAFQFSDQPPVSFLLSETHEDQFPEPQFPEPWAVQIERQERADRVDAFLKKHDYFQAYGDRNAPKFKELVEIARRYGFAYITFKEGGRYPRFVRYKVSLDDIERACQIEDNPGLISRSGITCSENQGTINFYSVRNGIVEAPRFFCDRTENKKQREVVEKLRCGEEVIVLTDFPNPRAYTNGVLVRIKPDPSCDYQRIESLSGEYLKGTLQVTAQVTATNRIYRVFSSYEEALEYRLAQVRTKFSRIDELLALAQQKGKVFTVVCPPPSARDEYRQIAVLSYQELLEIILEGNNHFGGRQEQDIRRFHDLFFYEEFIFSDNPEDIRKNPLFNSTKNEIAESL